MDTGLRALGREDAGAQGQVQRVEREGVRVVQERGVIAKLTPQQTAAALVRVRDTDLPGRQQGAGERAQPDLEGDHPKSGNYSHKDAKNTKKNRSLKALGGSPPE